MKPHSFSVLQTMKSWFLRILKYRQFVTQLPTSEADPDRPAPVVSWVEAADFYEELRSIVKEQMR